MTSVEPKSGKLYKFGQGLFGPKWTEKWVHLDQHVLKYFSMASEQTPLFSLSSARQSFSIELAGYDFVLQEDKRITRKHVFHLVPKNKAFKAYVFACGNEKELYEWQDAFQSRSGSVTMSGLSPAIAEKIRRASDAFTAGDMSEYSLIQQQLDPNVEGKISRDQFIRVMKHYFATRSRPIDPQPAIAKKTDTSSPRSSFSDVARHTKHSEMSEPEVVSEMDSADEPHEPNNLPTQGHDTVVTSDIPASSTAQDVYSRAWQHEFECLLRETMADDDPLSRGLEVAAFMAEFQRAAENAMEVITSEIAVDDSPRSLSPIPLDDDQFLATDYSGAHEDLRLGLSKFVVDGLMVYVTHDDAVRRVFGHQLRAAKAIHDVIMATNATLLQVPLQCVIDYMGFRGLIIAPSPDQQSTRILSSRMLLSCDRNSQMLIRQQLTAVWKCLGIFTEDFGRSGDPSLDRLPQFIGSAAGVSTTHSSGRVVCCLQNLIDIFPNDGSCEGSIWRPSFVSQLGERLPLYPQSCVSSFSEDQRSVLAQANITADEHLRSVLVPAFVDTVEAQSSSLCDSYSLTEACHREGLNARYLGLCFEAAQSKHVKRLFLSEMVARACKRELQASLQLIVRDALSEINRVVRDSPSSTGDGDVEDIESSGLQALPQEILVDNSLRMLHEFFNLVFDHGSSDSRAFWHEHIIPRMEDQFVFSSSDAFGDFTKSLAVEELLHWPQLLQALQYHANVSITGCDEFHFSSSLPFPDPECFSVRPKTDMLCVTTVECNNLLTQTDELISCGHAEQALEIVKAHIAMIDSAPQGDSSPALGRLLLCAAEINLLLEHQEEAERFASLALETSENNSGAHARAKLMMFRLKLAQSKPLEELLLLFTEGADAVNTLFGVVHPLLFDFYSTMIEAFRRHQDRGGVDQVFAELAVLVKDCYGKSCVAYADVRRNQGLALIESGRTEEAASVLDEAYSMYDRLQQEHVGDPAIAHDLQSHGATCLYLIAMLQAARASTNGVETAFSTAVRALDLRESVLPPDHPDITNSLMQLGELCTALGDFYRAQEYYRRALVHLKALPVTEESLAQIRKVSQAALNAHLRSLPAEKLALIEKIKSRFATTTDAMEAVLTASDSSHASSELELIRQVTHGLLETDPVEYLDTIIDHANDELQAQRRDRFASETVRRESAAEEPTLSSPSAAPGSRFASFAIGQSPVRSPPLAPTSTHSDAPSLRTPTGELSYSAQLAALLFLAWLAEDDDHA